MSGFKIAKKLGLHSFIVSELLKDPKKSYDFHLKIKEDRQRILELWKAGMSNNDISKETGIKPQTVSKIKIELSKDPNTGVVYTKTPHGEESKWYKIIERTDVELEWYRRNNLYPPTKRKMYYRLIELRVLDKSKNNYEKFLTVTAEACRGIDSSFTKPSRFPKLPLDCFRDDKKVVLGEESDLNSLPSRPTPDRPPEDPEEYIDYAIEDLKSAPENYSGRCESGLRGRNPGYWYMQPNYVEIWVESTGLQKDLVSFQGDRKVKVVANGGWTSVDYIARNCQRLKQIMDTHDYIEKVVILYFGDLDSSGDFMDEWLERALEFYGVENFEIVRIAITEEQMLEYDLVTDPEKTMKGKNKNRLFPRFKAKYPELVRKYGEKFGIQLEAFLTTDEKLEAFKKIVKDAIDEYWSEDIWEENCPPEEYDYDANEVDRPEDIDEEEARPMMYQKITEAFQPGWEVNYQ